MKKTLVNRDLISINDFSKKELELILSTAERFERDKRTDLLQGFILASCFFEPSTRTRLSFEAAMHRLGGSVIGFADGHTTSAKKGESLYDSMRVIGNYADLIVIRHPEEGAAAMAARATDKPVINGGDGANQHPTQTLVDLYTILKCQGKIDHLHIGIAGDLKYGRTVHSLVLGLSHFAIHLHLTCPKNLELPPSILNLLQERGLPVTIHKTFSEMIPHLDILYMTRIQKERLPEGLLFENRCMLKSADLQRVKANLRILHPLPRVDEIEQTIDDTPYAAYFEQAANALPVRMALLALLSGKF